MSWSMESTQAHLMLLVGPLRVLFYINDLLSGIIHSKVNMFADDTKFQKIINVEEYRTSLQSDQHAVSK